MLPFLAARAAEILTFINIHIRLRLIHGKDSNSEKSNFSILRNNRLIGPK